MALDSLLPAVRDIALQAGELVVQIYQRDFEVRRKHDDSPVTEADLAANSLIENALRELTPQIPVLSEESERYSFAQRSLWRSYWLLDPLDGTRSFVKKTGEFTVNIALIEQHEPVLGVVYAPILRTSYWAARGQGAYKRSAGQQVKTIHAQPLRELPVITGSRSGSRDMERFLQNVGEHRLMLASSSIKICWVAEGVADLYPRLRPTAEWDTAAAHAILNEAGGRLLQSDMQPLYYNKKASLRNPYFFAMGKHPIDWSQYLK